MANEISIPETGNLHKVIEFVERMSDKVDGMEKEAAEKVAVKTEELHARTAELGEQSAALTAELEGLKAERDAIAASRVDADAKLAALEARCDALDSALPAGEKSFVAATEGQHAAAVSMGRAITEARRGSRGEGMSEQFKRVNTESSAGTDTGVVVPTELHTEVIKGVFERSIPRQICRIIPMTSDQIDVATVASPPLVSVRGASNEGGTVTPGDVTVGSKTLTALTYVAINKISKELDEDSLIALEPLFGDIYTEAIADKENNQFITQATNGLKNITRGASAGQMRSISLSADSATLASNLVFADIPALMFAVDDGYTNNGTFITSAHAFKEIVALKDDSNGTPLFASSWGGGGIAGPGSSLPSSMAPGFLAGRPVFLTSHIVDTVVAGDAAEDVMYYGDFSKYAMGDRRAITIQWDDSVFANELNRAIIVSERVAFAPLLPEALAVLVTDAT